MCRGYTDERNCIGITHGGGFAARGTVSRLENLKSRWNIRGGIHKWPLWHTWRVDVALRSGDQTELSLVLAGLSKLIEQTACGEYCTSAHDPIAAYSILGTSQR